MCAYVAVGEDDAVCNPRAFFYMAVGSNCDIWSDKTLVRNCTGRVDEYIAGLVLALSQQRRLILPKRLEVQSCSHNEVLWLPDIHPEAVQNKTIKLLFFGHFWENFALYRGRSVFDSLYD